jgi:hypothetical protein
MEIQSGVFWSSGLLDRWESRTGYSPVKYLPFLFQQSNPYRAAYLSYNKTFLLGNSSGENTYLQDYRETLSEGMRSTCSPTRPGRNRWAWSTLLRSLTMCLLTWYVLSHDAAPLGSTP